MDNPHNENLLNQQPFMKLISSVKESLLQTDAKDVKKSFENQIKSKRTLSEIRNCADLLDVLVLRDVICEEYVDLLTTLVTDRSKLDEINFYKKFHITESNCRICHISLESDPIPIPQPVTPSTVTVTPTVKEDDESKVFFKVAEYLSSRLGADWVHLARKLDLPEFEIVNIKENNPHNATERAYQMFVRWQQINGIDADVEKIMHALGRGQHMRNDLVRDINNGKHMHK